MAQPRTMSTHIKIKSSPQDSVLSCPICMDIYKTPRMLPCQHTLCEACLHSYIVSKSRERVLVSDFPCPVCRSITPSPQAFTRIDTWASLFPLNHLLVSLLDNQNTILTVDSDNDEATTEKCSEHSGKHIEFFCTEHSLPICSKCFKNNHRQCDVIDIEDHIEFTSRFRVVRMDLQNLNKYLEDTIAHLKSNIEQLGVQKSVVLNEIKDFRNKVEAFLTGLETDVKEQVNLNHDGEVIVLKAQCEKYERIKAEVAASENILDELPLTGNITQTLDTLSTVENEVKGHGTVLDGCHANIKMIKLDFKLGTQLLGYLNSGAETGHVYVEQFDTELATPPEIKIQTQNTKEPPVPAPRERANSGNEANQYAGSRIRSPRSVITSRSSASAANQISQRPSSRDPQGRNTTVKTDAKRPVTVPIENNMAVPVVVRPRAERPMAQTMSRYPFRSFTATIPDGARFSREDIAGKYQTSTPRPEIFTTVTETSAKEVGQKIHSDMLESLHITVIDSDGTSDVDSSSESSSSSSLAELVNPEPLGATGEKPSDTRARMYVNTEISRHPDQLIARRSQPPANASKGTGSEHPQKSSETRNRSKSDSVAEENSGGASAEATPAKPQLLRQCHSLGDEKEAPVYENASAVMQQLPPREQTTTNLTTKREQAKEMDTKPASPPKVEPAKRAVKISDLNAHISTDAHASTITGATILPDSRLILVDCNNSRIKLMSNDFVFQAHCHMSKEPWNATCISPHEVAVTIPLEKSIQIVRVFGNNMAAVRCISTRRECWGICYLDDKFIITAKDDGNAVIFMDKSGRELQVINFASRENPNILRPVSVTLNPKTSLLYISCEGQSGTKGSLVTLSTTGDILHILTDKDLDRPYSCALDNDNNVYVTGIRSSNLLQVLDGGKVVKLLSRDNGLGRPQHVQMLPDAETPRFFVSERRSNTLYLYEMQ